MSGDRTGYETLVQPGETSTQRLFFDDEAYAPPAPAVPDPRPLGAWRHLGSLVLALALTPVALVLVDYGMLRRVAGVRTVSGDVDSRALLALLGAGALLFLVAVLARLSPLGPFLAGLVWGLAPWVLVTFFPERVLAWLGRLPDLYDRIGTSAPYYGFGVYAAVAALLVGTGCAAAWHRR